MLELIKKNPRAAAFAVAIHVLILVLLIVSFHFKTDHHTLPGNPAEKVIQAVTVDEKRVEKELAQIKSDETRHHRELEARARSAEAARKKEEERLALTKRKQQEQAEADNKRLSKLKQEQQALADKRKKEESRLKSLETERKAEEQRLQQVEQQRREDELRRKMAAEQQRLSQEQNTQRVSMINKYRSLIEAQVRRQWRVPPGTKLGMSCELRVRLIPSGDVMQVQVTKSSGNTVFDRSVETAVRMASPLPLPPPEANLFDEFRELVFPFTLEKS